MSEKEPVVSRTALGLVLVAVGLFVLVDVALVARISALAIGAAAVVAGALQMFHGFWTKDWGGFLSRILLGVLYVGFGIALVTQPGFGSLFLLYTLGLVLVASGMVRVWMGVRERGSFLWLLVSGLFGIAAGLVILSGWPVSGIRVIAVLLGIDLVIHGIGWLAVVWRRN